MLKIFKDGKSHPILNRQNFNIVRDYEGALTLSFDIRTNDKVKEYLQEEAIIQYRDNFYKIKTINQRKAITSISATLDMNEWQSKMLIDYDKTYALFSEVMLEITPKDWVIEGAGSVTGRRAIHIEGASAYEILMTCKSLYGIVYEYHIMEKRIKVIKPDVVQSRGLYITDELNLKDLEFKGSSSNLCTRLYARGKKTETKDEEGNTTSIEYVNFASINGGKIYVDNNDYSDNVIALYWQDDRYTDSQSLLDDAIEKLKSLASPERSYSCTLMDLSRTNDKYKMLDFQMYDKVTLMDNVSKTCLQHQIVQYTEYPDDPNKNEVVLSSVFKKITGTIDGIKQSVSDIDTEIKRTENSINEIIRDVASNTARIKNTYTKGETDIQIESVVQQTADEINQSITKIEETVQKIDTTYYHAELTCSGTSITRDNSSITMSVQLLNKSDEVPTSDSVFNWKRVSSNAESDTAWNNAHKGRKSITITSSDLEASANFYCDVSAPEWQGSTSAVTVVDETKVPQLGNSFLDVTGVNNVQTLNIDGSYSPSWVQTNPVITPSVIDGVLDVPLGECAFDYKRLISGTEQPLISGEIVKDGILTISKNVLSKALTAITYVAHITYKGVTIKLFTSFSLNIIGQDGSDGNDGQDGKDGSDGKGIVSRLIYHAVSTSDTVAPTTGWTTTTVTRPTGQYLWSKEITKFSDGTEAESSPIVISGDKGDTGKGIKSYAITYQASTSGTTAPTGTWSNTIPTVQQGQYLWSRTITTYTDNTTSTAYSVSYIPVNGTSVSVKSTSVMYQVSTNGTTAPTGEWKSSIPTVPKGQYLWTRTIVTYTDDKSTTAYSVSYQPTNGANGTSVTVSSTKTTYQASNSGTTVPTGTWSDTPIAGTAGQYVWTRTIVTYSDGKSTTSYSISRNGNNGATGATGTSTASTVQQYFLSTSKVNPTGGSWTTTPPTWSSGKYLWTRFVITYKNPASTEYTVPVCDSSWEAVNEIEVGGRNLLLKSNHPVTNTGYPIKTYTMTEKMVANETYTCTLWGTLGTGKSYFGLWLDGGNIGLGSLVKISDGIYQLTFKGKTGTLDTSVLHVYPVASTVSAESTITKIKLEKGNKATDWSPATEDINQDIVDAEVRITESYNSAIKLKDEEIRQFVTKSVEEVGDWESALNTLRNEVVLTKDSTEFLKTSSQIIKDLQTGKVDINEIKEWARFTGAILELGASNSEYKVKLSPTELGFYQGNTKVAWISNNELNVTRIVAGESVTIKTFIFVDEGSYGFTLKKVGG